MLNFCGTVRDSSGTVERDTFPTRLLAAGQSGQHERNTLPFMGKCPALSRANVAELSLDIFRRMILEVC
jgi:hypothetical protein